jgi:hypothetical protein
MKKTKKTMSGALVVAMMFAVAGLAVENAQAGTSSSNTVVNLTVDPLMNVACTPTITMGNILLGTGKSNLATNTAACTVKTNASNGYSLALKNQTAINMTSGSDTIAPITAVGAPVVWNATAVPATASGWGFRLSSTSTTSNTAVWGVDDQSGTNYGATAKWYKTATTDYALVTRTSETTFAGDTENINFGAEVGASMLQPTGTYSNTVVITGTSL